MDKDTGSGSCRVWELIILPDGDFPTQNTPFPEVLKKALSEEAIPESYAYFPTGFPE